MANEPVVKEGDRITLNERAAVWTRGKTFIVDEIFHWGVICHTDQQNDKFLAYYRASWEQVELTRHGES